MSTIQPRQKLNYSEFKNILNHSEQGKITHVTLLNENRSILVRMIGSKQDLQVSVPAEEKEFVISSLKKSGIAIDTYKLDIINLISLPMILILGLCMIFKRVVPATK